MTPIPGAPDKNPARIAGMFDAISPRYDLLNHLLSAGLDSRWRARAVSALGLRDGDAVLDVCCGTGDLSIAAAAGRPRRRVRIVGVDFAGAMLARGLEKIRARGLGDSVAFVRADATALPLAAGSMTAAMIAFGIRNVDDPERAARELARVLKPGGRLAILEFGLPRAAVVRQAYLWYFRHVLPRIGRLVSRHTDAYTYLPASVGSFPEPQAIVAMLERAGFESVRAHRLSLGIVHLYLGTRP